MKTREALTDFLNSKNYRPVYGTVRGRKVTELAATVNGQDEELTDDEVDALPGHLFTEDKHPTHEAPATFFVEVATGHSAFYDKEWGKWCVGYDYLDAARLRRMLEAQETELNS